MLFFKAYLKDFSGNETAEANEYTANGDNVYEATAVPGDILEKPPQGKKNTMAKMLANIKKWTATDIALRNKVEEYAKQQNIITLGSTINSLSNVDKADLTQIENYILEYKRQEGEQTTAAVGTTTRSLENYFNSSSSSGLGLKRKSFIGRGISPQISDKIYVDMTHLNSQKLALKYKSTQKLLSPPVAITQSQKESIILIMANKYTKKKYDDLRSEEKELIQQFVIATKAKNVDFINQTRDLRGYLEIQLGLINAGNDNPEIRKNAAVAIQELYKQKNISRLEMLSLLRELGMY